MGTRRKTTLVSLALAVLTAALFAGCSTGPEPDKYPLSGDSYVINGKRYYVLASSQGYSEEGVASWYGKQFHGRKTANGERYDMYGLTAAHKTLPLGTWVSVTNLNNRKELTVRVNDRGPFARGRIIDLSYGAAQKLGIVGTGTADVRVTALGTPEDRKVAGQWRKVLVRPVSYDDGRFAVQVGAFSEKQKAMDLADRIKKDFGVATIQRFDDDRGTFFRVHVADVNTMNKALQVQERLEQLGFRDCFVVAR